MENNEIKRTDRLALVRTQLANERTFLAYFRTAIVFLSSGVVILKIEGLQNLVMLAYILIVAAIGLLVFGVTRFVQVKNKIKRQFNL